MQIRPISGFSELTPEKYLEFDRMKEILKKSYTLCGFSPIETPVCERKETLLAKGGDDNEIYGVHRLNGEKEDGELALRFDLTVPLARYVSMNEGTLKFPFKRFHIDRVWRGERAQAGRAREFYQADVDIIGRDKLPLFADVESIFTVYTALKNIDFGDFVIHLNNKKILIGFLESVSIHGDLQQRVIGLIDKKDKLKQAKKDIVPILAEIISGEQLSGVLRYIEVENESYEKKVEFFCSIQNSLLQEGIQELVYVYTKLQELGLGSDNLVFNNTIARGLNYYTGTLLETFIVGAREYGSIASGGRYENLVGSFSKSAFPGVGVSIGLTRLFQVLDMLGKLKFEKQSATQVLVLNFDENILSYTLGIVRSMRSIGVNTEVYLDSSAKMKKQLDYADTKGIPYVLICGEDEFKNSTIVVKNMKNGEQTTLSRNEMESFFKNIFIS